MIDHPRALHIGAPELETSGDHWRVTAVVNGAPVWFEGFGLKPRAAPEAFASAFLLPAMARGIPLRVDSPLDQVWLDHISEQQEIFHRWWKYRVIQVEAETKAPAPRPQSARAALFFTCGSDSFYSLLHGGRRIDALVTVHGYDVPLWDEPRSAMISESVADIARVAGILPVYVRTNLRDHEWFKRPGWQKTHGGALAAVGHLLSADFGQWLISSSSHYSYDFPYGSHWDTDPLWSSSSVAFLHFGADVWRSDKLAVIADSDLAREYLTVCYRQQGVTRNCQRCEKCVRTMMILRQHGRLADFKVFANTDLPALINAVPAIESFRIPVYRQYLAKESDPVTREALERLIARSKPWRQVISKKKMRFRQSLDRRLERLTGWLKALLPRKPANGQLSAFSAQQYRSSLADRVVVPIPKPGSDGSAISRTLAPEQTSEKPEWGQ